MMTQPWNPSVMASRIICLSEGKGPFLFSRTTNSASDKSGFLIYFDFAVPEGKVLWREG
jgi:hypothetical protein